MSSNIFIHGVQFNMLSISFSILSISAIVFIYKSSTHVFYIFHISPDHLHAFLYFLEHMGKNHNSRLKFLYCSNVSFPCLTVPFSIIVRKSIPLKTLHEFAWHQYISGIFRQTGKHESLCNDQLCVFMYCSDMHCCTA